MNFATNCLFSSYTHIIYNLKIILSQWINDSFNYWDELRITEDGAKAGVTQLSGYLFSSTHPEIVRVGTKIYL